MQRRLKINSYKYYINQERIEKINTLFFYITKILQQHYIYEIKAKTIEKIHLYDNICMIKIYFVENERKRRKKECQRH